MPFSCKIKHIDAYLLVLHNGVFDHKSIRQFPPPNGVEITESLENSGNFKIRIAPNTRVEKPLQIVNVVDTIDSINIENSLEIVVEEGSELSIIHCEESLNSVKNTIQTTVNSLVKTGATLYYYNLQNINNHSVLNHISNVEQHKNSRLISHTYTLNGKILNKRQHVNFAEESAFADVQGLYLLDKNQDYTHHVRIQHNFPNSKSNQLFKGVLDDSAKGIFEGHVFVAKHAQKTEAFQSNKNLLLTDKANMQTHPFLEIYADDVKCSHGATIGQLDEEALFYLRTRGISKKQAKTLLMYAFANDVVRNVHLEPLREYLENLIKRRLNGENITCEDCVFLCQ